MSKNNSRTSVKEDEDKFYDKQEWTAAATASGCTIKKVDRNSLVAVDPKKLHKVWGSWSDLEGVGYLDQNVTILHSEATQSYVIKPSFANDVRAYIDAQPGESWDSFVRRAADRSMLMYPETVRVFTSSGELVTPDTFVSEGSGSSDADLTQLQVGDKVKEVTWMGQFPQNAVLTVVDVKDGMVGLTYPGQNPKDVLYSPEEDVVKVESYRRRRKSFMIEDKVDRMTAILSMGDFIASSIPGSESVSERLQNILKLRGNIGVNFDDAYAALNVLSDDDLTALYNYALSCGLPSTGEVAAPAAPTAPEPVSVA